MIAIKHNTILGVTLTAAVLLPVHSATADSTTGVSTRGAEQIERDFGRSSGDAYWQRRQPEPVPAAIVDAYTETKEFLTQPPTTPQGPERYGRAGGFVGVDNLESPAWAGTTPASGG